MVLVTLLTALTPTVAAPEGEKPPDPNAPVPAPRVFTNKDLARYRSARRPANLVVDTTALKQGQEGGEPPADEALYPDEKERRIGEVQQSIREAEARIADLDKRSRSLANPFLPRPQVSQEEKDTEASMDARQILAKVQAEKADLEGKIAALKAEMDRLIAAPTRPRGASAPAPPAAHQQQPPP